MLPGMKAWTSRSVLLCLVALQVTGWANATNPSHEPSTLHRCKNGRIGGVLGIPDQITLLELVLWFAKKLRMLRGIFRFTDLSLGATIKAEKKDLRRSVVRFEIKEREVEDRSWSRCWRDPGDKGRLSAGAAVSSQLSPPVPVVRIPDANWRNAVFSRRLDSLKQLPPDSAIFAKDPTAGIFAPAWDRYGRAGEFPIRWPLVHPFNRSRLKGTKPILVPLGDTMVFIFHGDSITRV